jgi:3-mercaptopyruvate sulfurtransferase SseA
MVKKIMASELDQILWDSNSKIVFEISDGETHARCHIPSALQLNLCQIYSDIVEKIPNKNQKVVFYAETFSDPNPMRAARPLEVLGYENVYVYPGGKSEWRDLGYQIESDHYPILNTRLNPVALSVLEGHPQDEVRIAA